MDDQIRQRLRQMNITFASFKQIIACLLTKDAIIDEDSYTDFFIDYTETLGKYEFPIEEWAENHFMDFSIECHSYELRTKQTEWVKITPDGPRPAYNISIILHIPEENNAEGKYTEYIEGMWDISKVWTDIRSYDKVEPDYYKLIQAP